MRAISKVLTPSLILVLLACALSFNAHAEDLYNIDDFEIIGIQTGMLPEDALQKLSQHYSISPDDFSETVLTHNPPFFNGEDQPTEYSYSDSKVWITLKLNAKLDPDEEWAHVIVGGISINPQGKNREERPKVHQVMREEFTAKYGPPTLTIINDEFPERSQYFWCETTPTKEDRCNRRESFAHFGYRGFTLRNTKYTKAFAAEKKARLGK